MPLKSPKATSNTRNSTVPDIPVYVISQDNGVRAIHHIGGDVIHVLTVFARIPIVDGIATEIQTHTQ